MGSQPHQCPPPTPPLLLPAFPGTTLLLTPPDTPRGKLIVKLKPEGTQEPPRTQTIILAGVPSGWPPSRRDGVPLRFQLATGIRTIMLSKAGEQSGPKEIHPVSPALVLPPSSAGDSSASCTSKGVYENYRRWQRYKALARQHFPGTPDAEALACFFIPVLRSLSRLRPELAPEEGVLRAVQEWERSSNFERMIFYEMAEKFMEFEAEEELQIQKMKLLSSSQFQPPPMESPKPLASDPSQQQVYIPKKAASKGRQPRRRQRRLPGPPVTGEPREIPPEAVRQYTEIMEGLRPSWEEEDREADRCREPQSQEQGVLPDPGLLEYLEQLCEDENFVYKVEAVIHPQFLAQLLSPEKQLDPLDLSEELEQELGLTPSQLVEKRLLAFSEEELSPATCPALQSDSTPSQSEEEDESGGLNGLTGLCQFISGALLPRGCGTLGTESPEGLLTPGPDQMSQSSQWQPVAMSFEDIADPKGPSPWKRDGPGKLLASLRSQVERASQQPHGKGQNGGRREDSEVTLVPVQPGSQVWGLTSQEDNLVGLANLKSAHSGYRRQDDHQEGKVKGWSETSTGVEQLGDALMGTECNCHGDKLVESGNLESTPNEQKTQDDCQKEMMKGQPQASWEPLGDVPRDTGQAKIIRSCRGSPVKQVSLESTLNGHEKQNGGQEGKVRVQNEEADWSAAPLREHDLQSGSTRLSGKNMKGEKSPSSDPTRHEEDGSQAGLLIKLDCRVGSAHTMASGLGKVNGQPLGLAHQPLAANRQEEGEWPRGSNIHGQHPDPKEPAEMQAASEANSCCRVEPRGRFVMATGSIQPRLKDGSNHKGHGICSMSKPDDLEQKEARATRVCGKGTGSQNDGKEVGESSSAMGDGPSKMSAITHPTGDMDVGKHSNDEEDEELSIFSILLASKLRLSSPEGPFGAVPTLRDQPVPHSRALSLTWEPIRGDNMRKSSTRPGEGLSGVLPTDHGIQRSHKRQSDKMPTRRSKRLRSQ